MLQKFTHVVILHMLKIYLSKSKGKFKSGKSGNSQGIFAPDMGGNPVAVFSMKKDTHYEDYNHYF